MYYTQEARTYALTLALALISCWALLVWLKQRRARYLFLNAAATLGCLYTHYSLLLLPFAQTVFVLLTFWRNRQRSQPSFTTPIALGLNFFVPLPHQLPKLKFKFSRKLKPIWQWLIVQALVVVLFLPWPIHARYGLRQLFAPQANPSPFTMLQQVANFARTTLLEFSASQSLPWPLAEAIALAFVGLIALGLLAPALPKLSRRFLATVLLLPPLIMLLLPRTSVYYAPKYLIMITPAFYILTVVGAEALWQARAHFFTRRVVAALGVMLFIGVPVLSIGWAAMQPFQADKIVQSFWEDDPQDSSAAGYYYPYSSDVAFLDEGVTLSQLKVLPIHALSLEGIDTSGKVHIHSTFEDTWTYDPATGVTQTIGGPDHFYPGDSAMTSDGRWYSLIQGMDDTHLALIDPATGTTRDLGNVPQTTYHLLIGSHDQVYGLAFYTWPIFKYDPRTDLLAPVPFSDTYHLDVYIEDELIGQDDWLYGTLRYETPTIFALNLNNGELITRDMSLPVGTLVPRPGGGVYVNSGQNFWIFDASGRLTPLPPVSSEKNFHPDLLILQNTGHLAGRSNGSLPYFFDYDPVTGAIQRLQSKANSGYYDRLMAAPNGDLYTTWGDYLALINSGQYTTTGYVNSQAISPVVLPLTNTIVGGYNASVAALACGQNGKVYGVKSDPATSKWLFEYDPQQPGTAARQIAPNVSPEDKGRFLAGTALMPLNDGRLVGGTNNGHLFVYTPTTDETWDVDQVAEGKQQIASLAVDGVGMVYGSRIPALVRSGHRRD